jgi:hypothetical protein
MSEKRTATAWSDPDALGIRARRSADDRRVVGVFGFRDGYWFWWATEDNPASPHAGRCATEGEARSLADLALESDGWTLLGQQALL